MVNVQELISKELFEDENDSNNDMLQILEFVKREGVPLNSEQVKGYFLLKEFGLSDIGNYAVNMRTLMTPVKKFFDMVGKITLADRIKGTAKLDKLLKAQVSSPSSMVASSDLQPKALKEKELNR